MTTDNHEQELRNHLWKALDDKKTGMLGLADAQGRHMQPMTAYAEPETQSLWFFTYNNTELAREIADGATGYAYGMFCLESNDHTLHACIAGAMQLVHDTARIEKYWSPMTAAWFPDGKRDPRLTLIRFDLHDAHVWHMDKGRFGFLYEIVKANLTDTLPHAGIHANVKF